MKIYFAGFGGVKHEKRLSKLCGKRLISYWYIIQPEVMGERAPWFSKGRSSSILENLIKVGAKRV
jgi:hypothetical protein